MNPEGADEVPPTLKMHMPCSSYPARKLRHVLMWGATQLVPTPMDHPVLRTLVDVRYLSQCGQ